MGVRAQILRWLALVVVVAGAALATGCATTDADNMSARPWNAPRSWESGLPGGMLEGR